MGFPDEEWMAAKTQSTKTKKELEGERTRAQIIEAAVELFARRGYRATSVAMIAKACKISTATVFWHFGSKEGLLQAIFSEMFTELEEMMAEKKTGTPVPGFPVVPPEDLEYFMRHADRMRMLLSLALEAEVGGGKLQDLMRNLLRAYVEVLTEQIARIHKMPKDQARERAQLFVSVLAGIIVLRVADPEKLNTRALVERALKTLLAAPEPK